LSRTQCSLAVVVCWIVVVAVAAIPSRAAEKNDRGGELEKTLTELNERVLEEYILNNNVEPLEGIATADFFVETPVGIESRKQVIETVGNLDVDSIAIENTEIHLYGPTEVLAGTVKVVGQLGGRPMPPITYLSVYAQEGDRCRLFARSLTPRLASPRRPR